MGVVEICARSGCTQHAPIGGPFAFPVKSDWLNLPAGLATEYTDLR